MTVDSAPNDAHLQRLKDLLRNWGSVLVCYSGGVDSALVLAVAHDVLGHRCVGLTAVSPSLATYEREAAIALARRIGARHELVESSEIDDPDYQRNDTNRCFHCKSELYRISALKQAEWDIAVTVNGINLDDLGDHRPGIDAARRAGVKSPLVEAGFTKSDVRRVAALIGLSVWDKPASACLSSRLPFGTQVTRERLAQVGGLEAELKALGLKQVRVRYHALGTTEGTTGGAIARIEVARDEMDAAYTHRDAIVEAGKRFGFAYVTMDLQGYRVGSHNEVLAGKSLRVI